MANRNYKLEGVAVRLVKDRPLLSREKFDNADKIVELMARDMMDLDREEVRAIFFDTEFHPLAWHQVSIGSLDRAITSPREIMKGAILLNARGLVLFHNHPGDNPQPSDVDDATTARIHKACNVMGITLFDHIIVAPSGEYYSYADKGSKHVGEDFTYSGMGISPVAPDLPGLSLVAEG